MLKTITLILAFYLIGDMQLKAQSPLDTNYIVVFYNQTNYDKHIPYPKSIILTNTPIKFKYGYYQNQPEKQHGNYLKCINDSQLLIEVNKSVDTFKIDSFILFKTDNKNKYTYQVVGSIIGTSIQIAALYRLINCPYCPSFYSEIINFIEAGLIGSVGNVFFIIALANKQSGMNVANGLAMATYAIPASVMLDSKSINRILKKT